MSGEQAMPWGEIFAVITIVIAIFGAATWQTHTFNKRIDDAREDSNKRFDKADRDSAEAHKNIGNRIDGVEQAVNGLAREVSYLAGRKQGEVDALTRKDEK